MTNPNVQRGRANREKGKRGEREVKNIFNWWFKEYGIDNLEARRVLTESRESSFDVEIGTPGSHDRLPFAIQVKNVSSQFGGWILKAWQEAFGWDTNGEPVGIVKVPSVKGMTKRDSWVATISLDHYAELISKSILWDKGHTRREKEE